MRINAVKNHRRPLALLGFQCVAVVMIGCRLMHAAPSQASPTPSPSPSVPALAQPGQTPSKDAAVPSNPAAPIPTEAHRMALEAAGAFQNDAFRIRDGEWGGTLVQGVLAFLSVTLFAGESYWFVAASPTPGATLRLTLYDAQGKSLKTEQWKDDAHGAGARFAAGFASPQSGKYYVSISLVENPSGQPAEFSVIYAYK